MLVCILCALKPCPHCRRKVRLSPKTARQQRNSATIALFCDSVDRLLGKTITANAVFVVAACKEVTELNAAVDGSVEYPTSGVYAANMRCRWRLHAPVGMVSTSLLSYCIPFP